MQKLLARVARFRLLDPGSLRVQLTLRVWLVMILLFAINNALELSSARSTIVERVRREQEADSDYLAYGVKRWSLQLYQGLLVLSHSPVVRGLQPTAVQSYFDVLHRGFPSQQVRLYNRQGRLIAATGPRVGQTETMRGALLNRPYFHQAILGGFGFDIDVPVGGNASCLLLTGPIYSPDSSDLSAIFPSEYQAWISGLWHADASARGHSSLAAPSPSGKAPAGPGVGKPVGMIELCRPLNRLGVDSGLMDIAETTVLLSADNKHALDRPLDLQALPSHGSLVLLLSRDGHLIFPALTGLPRQGQLTPAQLQASPWGPFVRQAMASGLQPTFRNLELEGRHWLVTTRQVDAMWSLALIVDQASAYEGPDALLNRLVRNELLVLLFSALAIFLTCSQWARPIQRAGVAIRRLAAGDFEVQLPLDRRDEIGNLYRDIHETALHLRQFLKEQTAYAVTRKQIETGRAIQQSFLVDRLPQGANVSLAASFNPALEVAGDWYDAMEIQGITYVVVADVCDKGVGAALFMSVFRTLLRYEILRTAAERQVCSDYLASIVTLVNEYMAETHAESTMFATLFVAAVDPQNQRLSYICAGHELPFLLRHRAGLPLERLVVNGPAIGVFPGAVYTVNHLDFCSGDLLFAYTDGLTDARSPEGESWGLGRLEAQLAALQAGQAPAQEVVDQILEQVKAHMAGADPFDDLTMLALKAS